MIFNIFFCAVLCREVLLQLTAYSQNLRGYGCSNQTSGIRGTLSDIVPNLGGVVILESRRLSIPIYLNQRIVFDLLAIVEGGFSQLQTVKSSETGSQQTKKDASAEVGAKNVFAFLNLSLKGSIGKENTQSSQRAVEEERVFTPASLFSRLRDNLLEQGLLHSLDESTEIDDLEPGKFVEFSGILRKNPSVGYMEGIIQLMEVALLFTQGNGKQKPKAEQEVFAQMKKFLSMLTQDGSLDLVAELISEPKIKAVIPVQLEYFSNESPADIIDGQFVVLGKIIRYVAGETDESISLLRGTPLAFLPEENLTDVTQGLSAVGAAIKVTDEFVTHIDGPALLIVPIAIYA